MSIITVRAKITKNRKWGWSCITYTKYPDWPNETVTCCGYETLDSTLWHLVLTCIDWEAKLTTVHVRGGLMPKAVILDRVCVALAGSVLSYKLPAIKRYLSQEVTQ